MKSSESSADIWRDRVLFENVVDVWIELMTNTVLLIVVLATAFLVIFMRKRRDCFVLIVLTCYIISSTLRAYDNFCLIVYWDYEDKYMDLDISSKFFYLMAHWIFSA